ncbi:hypothetical protein [Halorussus halobius]|uniref:hypothetical protein n=1 Tax=Halorussus halobius TaxID=1710537 RepID=UPI0010927342|nr:hypothetical protein [Halorussus halobius]
MPERDSTPTDTSVVVAVARDLRDLSRWLESSSVARLYRRASTGAATAATNSTLAYLLGLLVTWTRESFLYRWLTKEPDPEVVVIDLRETYTVGPFIAILDRVVPSIQRWWSNADTRNAFDRTVSTLRNGPIRALGVVVTAAVLTDLLAVAVTGSLSPTGLLARAVALACALAATRVRASWDALARARTVQLLASALEPPEPPRDASRESPDDDGRR